MAKKTKESRLKKWWVAFKNYLTPLKSDGYTPDLELTNQEQEMMRNSYYNPIVLGNRDEDIHRRNAQKLEIAKLAQDKDAIDKNLRAQHRLVIATLILALVAVVSTIVAVIIALDTKQPTIMIKLDTNGKETIQTTH